MRLEQSDAELFYQLWFPLLDFVNRKYHVCPDVGRIDKRHGVDACGATEDFREAYMNAKNHAIRFSI